MDLRLVWLKKYVYFDYYAILHSSLKVKTKTKMFTDIAWSTDNNKASMWVSARGLFQGGSAPNSLFSHYYSAIMNFACLLRLCPLNASFCMQMSAPETSGNEKIRETEKKIRGFTMISWSLWSRHHFFEGIKISFCSSRRLFLLLLFLNVPATSCDIKKKDSDWQFWFLPCLPKFQLVKWKIHCFGTITITSPKMTSCYQIY